MIPQCPIKCRKKKLVCSSCLCSSTVYCLSHYRLLPHGLRPTNVPHKLGKWGTFWTFGQMPESDEAFSETHQGKGNIMAMWKCSIIPSRKFDVRWDSRVDCDRSYSSPPVIDGKQWAQPVIKIPLSFSLSLSRCYSLVFSVYSYWFTTTVSSFPHIQRARAQTLMILSKLPCGRRTNSATCYIFVKRHSFPLKQSGNLLSPCLISPCLCLKAIISFAFFFFYKFQLFTRSLEAPA